MSEPSAQAKAQIGRPTKWVQTSPRKRTIEGTCVGVRLSGSIIRTEEGEFPGVQFGIETAEGKILWTGTMADRPEGVV